MSVSSLATANLRFGISPAAAAACATGFLRDLITAGHLNPNMAYLACDPNKVRRARQQSMSVSKALDGDNLLGVKLTGLGYDEEKTPRPGLWSPTAMESST